MDTVKCFGQVVGICLDGHLSFIKTSLTCCWPVITRRVGGEPKYRARLHIAHGGQGSLHQFNTPEEAVAVCLYLHGGAEHLDSLRTCLANSPVCELDQMPYWSVGDFKIPQQSIREHGQMLEDPVLWQADTSSGQQVCSIGYFGSGVVSGVGQNAWQAIAEYRANCRNVCLSEQRKVSSLFQYHLDQLRKLNNQLNSMDQKGTVCSY